MSAFGSRAIVPSYHQLDYLLKYETGRTFPGIPSLFVLSSRSFPADQ